MAPDAVDAAIAATEQSVQLRHIGPLQIGTTGRPFFIDLPVDVQPIELVDIARWLLTQTIGGLQAQAQQTKLGPSIALPDGRLVPVKRTQ